ncbi:MAG: TIGR02996 domain-containing protein [Gemmataceae bacterium]|nr:TIGR02996 domain-containing protein [Gemmataceae bacterium]
MTDEADFLQNILDNPDEDANRLVYADWLEERGDPRAELIRLQVESDRQEQEQLGLDDWHWGICRATIMGGGDWGSYRSSWLCVRRDLPAVSGEVPDSADRVRSLLDEHGEELAGPVLPFVQYYGFRRGLLERAVVSLGGLLEHGETLFRRAPILDLTVTDWEDSPDELAEALSLPALARLTHLHLPGKHTAGAAVAGVLARATHLKRLTSLWLELAGIDSKGLELLANSPHLRSLTELHLEYSRIGLKGLKALTESRYLTRLRHLYLGGNSERRIGFGVAGARVLADWPRLKGLLSLDLGGGDLGDAGIAALAASPHCPKPTTLLLDFNEIGPKGAKALAGSRLLSCVQLLGLTENRLNSEALVALLGGLTRDTLTHLDLCNNSLADKEGITALADSELLGELRALELGGNHFGGEGLRALFGSDHLDRLRWLDLGNCGLDGAAMRALADCPHGLSLAHLQLNDNPLGDEGAAALANWPGVNDLNWLVLVETEIGEAGALALAASPYFFCLFHLDVSGNKLSKKAQAALRKRLGKEVVECAF